MGHNGNQEKPRAMTTTFHTRSAPTIDADNGPELISKAADEWAYGNGVGLHFIEPDKPVQNAIVESFNGKFRGDV